MKRLTALVLALALALSVCAFAGAEETVTLKIAHIGPLTGAAAVYGTATSRGATLAADEINGLYFVCVVVPLATSGLRSRLSCFFSLLSMIRYRFLQKY